MENYFYVLMAIIIVMAAYYMNECEKLSKENEELKEKIENQEYLDSLPKY